MSIKLAIKISDGGGAAYVGGSADEFTRIVEVENEELEKILNPFIKERNPYVSCSISLIREKEKK